MYSPRLDLSNHFNLSEESICPLHSLRRRPCSVTVANLLRGKHKVDFTPNVDCGDYVIVINTDKAILTGKKLEQKHYYRVSGWIGGLKDTKARDMMEKRSDYAMELAIKGMLPKNTIGRNALTRVHLYKGAEHPHAAQKPEAWTL